MKIRQGKDIILRWKITTNGEALPLEGRNLTLILSTPNGRERVLSYTTEGDTISTRLFGKEITLLGDYTLTLWENRGEQGQTAVDAVNAFELVKYTTMEEDGSSCGNLEAEVLSLSGDLGVFQQGTTTEKNEQVDMNTEDITELQQDMKDVQGDVSALENAYTSLRGEIANVKNKNAEQDEEIAGLLDILEGKLDIKDLGSGLRPNQAVSEIINYVRSNNIKSALVFKYIDTDNSSTFGICISRMGTSGWIIYLVARKGLEVLKFNSYGSRETWNEYGGVLRHDMNSVADEQLECLSIKGLKSVLAKKQDTLVSGTNIKTINGESIMGKGNIKIEAGITEEEEAEINAKIEGKADIADVENLAQDLAAKAPKVGYAPELKVNFAKELVGRGESTPEVIGGIRPTGVRSIGDGNATITKVRGNSVVWNQWVKDSQPANPTKRPSFIDGVCTLVAEQDIEAGTYIGVLANTQTRVKVGEKWLYTCSNPNVYIGDAWQYGNVPGRYFSKCYFSPTYSVADTHQMGFYLKDGLKAGTYTFTIGIHNLTLMFGSGNEPTTIEDFEARKPLGVTNEYNEGTIVSYNGDALKSVGFNAWDEEWEVGKINPLNGANVESTTFKRSANYTELVKNTNYRCTYTNGTSDSVWMMFFDLNGNPIEYKVGGVQVNNLSNVKNVSFVTPNQDCKVRFYVKNEPDSQVCIHLVHSGYRDGEYAPYEDDVHPLPDISAIKDTNGNQLFPHGLLSAGSIHDEITATKAIKRIGVVDMGTLNYIYGNNGNWNANRFYGAIPDAKPKYNYSCLSPIYIKSGLSSGGNKTLHTEANRYVYFRNDLYTSVADFKAAMSGVLLYYELAEPIEVDLPESLNMTYEAWDFGTEELVAKGATTPLNADIVYLFNAVDRIRENSRHVEESEAKLTSMEQRIAQLETMIASLTNTANDE